MAAWSGSALTEAQAATATAIVELLGTSTVSVVTAAKAAGIDPKTFWRWLLLEPRLKAAYLEATEARSELMAEDILALSDDPAIETDRARLMVETRKWLMSRHARKRYGDKEAATVAVQINTITPEDAAERMRMVLPALETARGLPPGTISGALEA